MRISLKIKRMRTVRRELKLFKHLMDTYRLRTDDDLADFLLCSKTIISMTRCDHRGLSPRLTLAIYDKTPLSIEDIRAMAKEYV
jgi:hypothetical protein